MAKTYITATVTATTELALSPKAKQMVLARAEEHAELARSIKKAKLRQERIRDEVDEVFCKEGQGKALLNGCSVDEFKFKMVTGHRKTLDKRLLVELGCDPMWLVEATTEEDNAPYIKISAPGEEKE